MRDGISVALALPNVPTKPAILAANYAVVLFSSIIQGTPLARMAHKWVSDPLPGINKKVAG